MVVHHEKSSFAGGVDMASSYTSSDLPLLTIPIRNNNNLQYYGSVKIGSEGKDFNVIFDTGSDKLWVPSAECTSSVCKAHNRLDSDTFRPDLTHSNLSYGTGQVMTKNGFDSVKLVGKGVHANRVVGSSFVAQSAEGMHEYPISLATSMTSKPFVSLKQIDGIFGMSQGSKFAREHPLYSIYLSNDTAKEGELNLGGVNSARAAGNESNPAVWHDTRSPDSWSLDLVDIKVGDGRLGLCTPDDPCTGLIDSGSSLITGPPSDVSRLLSKIHPTCGGGESPPVVLIFKNQAGEEVEYPLTSKEYTIDFKDTNECQVGFGPLNMGHKRWIIGDTFLRRYMGVFDGKHNKVGFIKSRHDDEDIGVVTRGMNNSISIMWNSRTRNDCIQKVGNDFLFN
jgi:cathepsin D